MINKIIDYTKIKNLVKDCRQLKKRIVFTNGCFDLLHAGHIHLLEQAKSKGDILIVGLNSDSSVRELKGKNRPIENQDIRIRKLIKLTFVDYIIIFNEKTAEFLIEAIYPDVYVKGNDYLDVDFVEGRKIKEYGGEMYFVELLEGYSTSALIKKQ